MIPEDHREGGGDTNWLLFTGINQRRNAENVKGWWLSAARNYGA